jgi:hypothetical protein
LLRLNFWQLSHVFWQAFAMPWTRFLQALGWVHESVEQKSRHWKSQSHALEQAFRVPCANTASGASSPTDMIAAKATAIIRMVMSQPPSINANDQRSKHGGGTISSRLAAMRALLTPNAHMARRKFETFQR